jgi:Family of unknown function (DUF6232)
MAANNLINSINQDRQQRIVDTKTLIEVTKKTVRFGSDVFQFRNVAGFGTAQIQNQNIVPILVIVGFLLFGLTLLNFGNSGWGWLLILAAIGGIVANFSQPERWGLKLYINSGDRIIFITKDIEGVKDIVTKLYEFMESESEDSYIVNIDQRHASIGVGYAEKIRAKKIGGTP